MPKSRQTRQKSTIQQGIEQQKSFFTAEELYNSIKKKDPQISLATIYRHLKNLRDDKQIYFYECEGKHTYSLEKKSHCHFTCEETGKVIHFDIDSLDFIKKKIPGSITSFQLEVKGICEKCHTSTSGNKKEEKMIWASRTR